MRIDFLSAAEIPSQSAESIYVMKMCHALAQVGHEVTLYAREVLGDAGDVFSRYDVDPIFQVVLKRWPKVRWLGGPIYGLGVRRALSARIEPDLLYARDIYSASLLVNKGVDLIYEVHVPPRNWPRRLLERRLLKRAVALIVTTQALAREYRRMFPALVPPLLKIAPNAADAIPLDRDRADGNTAMETTGVTVGYVGHLYPGKGMEVITAVAKRLPDIDFHVVGGTPPWIEHWSGRAGPNVYFHGFKTQPELASLLDTFDIVLAPYQEVVGGYGPRSQQSANWTSPMKVFEYMAHSKPIIASDLPAMKEILVHGETALLCSSTDVDSWAQAIRTLQSDAVLRARLARQARITLEMNHTWKARARTVLEGLV